ncbi:MAG: hypothetical protein CL744_00475 [Chloroflexi bacterium]|nr:hypothetical protein [Chloroflexota bacterium]
MAKNIALCFDGTWNDPDSNTNVIKMHRSIIGEDRTPKPVGGAVAPRDESSIKWYDKGVGTKILEQVSRGISRERDRQKHPAGLQIHCGQLRTRRSNLLIRI